MLPSRDSHLGLVEQVLDDAFVAPNSPLAPCPSCTFVREIGEIGSFVPFVQGPFNASVLPNPYHFHSVGATPQVDGHWEEAIQAMVHVLRGFLSLVSYSLNSSLSITLLFKSYFVVQGIDQPAS